ncbi:MAG: shikimate dehydrogenase [Acholeplasmataceae bacterium]|jgi:shikimate dehydrogenase|nr:shikimate dehydrogenase [Acholeplasmataceae bacterium]
MKNYGLLGRNISHSFSHKLHNLIAFKNNFTINYEILDITEKMLPNYLLSLKMGEYAGFNVTTPYKEKVIKYLDGLTPEAKAIGSVNTIVYKENKFIGHNTDYYGFVKLLKNNKIRQKKIKKAYILGTGGAAKTVYYALLENNIDCVVVSRNKAQKLPFEEVISYDEFSQIKEVELLINATPVGSYPKFGSPIKFYNQTFKIIIDLIYNPLKTELMRHSIVSINGLDMLIYQAIEAQNYFNNQRLKEDIKTIRFIKGAIINEFVR